jgi:hypothetical protein
MTDTPAFRGTPPNAKALKQKLGDRLALWEATIAMVIEFGAVWRWAHSEATNSWSYRAYLPGERFFTALSLTEDGFELSVNLKAEEWDWVTGTGRAEQEVLDALHEKAKATGEEPAWLHVPVTEEATLGVITKLLFARGRRVQAPRNKKRR